MKDCPICNHQSDPKTFNDLSLRQCQSCGLIWRANFDIDDSYYQKQEVALYPNKIRDRLINSHDRIKKFKGLADLNNLCDVGTGEGTFLKALKDEGYKNVIGLEPSDQVGEFVKENNLVVIKGTIEDLPKIVSQNQIHTITMFHLIEHLTNPLAALKSIYDSLQSGDKLIIETPNIDAYAVKKMRYKNEIIYQEHFFYFNMKTLKMEVKQAGFKIVAHGKRDFNQHNFSIKESLFRLGLVKPSANSNYGEHAASGVIEKQLTKNTPPNSWPRKMIRYLLNRLVIMLGRVDFIWLVVER